jgi:DNA-directed RNA polymerase sigma subunit (sigma70/sigma32)
MQTRLLLPSPDQALVGEELRAEVQRNLAALTPKQREVLTKLYGLDGNDPLSTEEIAEQHGVHRSLIWRQMMDALWRLRTTGRACWLRNFTEE